MNYALELARIRTARARATEHAHRDAQVQLVELRAARDAEIRRLAAEGLTPRSIAPRVGCCQSTVYEVLRPDAHDRYNQRRREHWRVYTGGRAA
jgi:DNA-binding NarL/FixJ family response regulator